MSTISASSSITATSVSSATVTSSTAASSINPKNGPTPTPAYVDAIGYAAQIEDPAWGDPSYCISIPSHQITVASNGFAKKMPKLFWTVKGEKEWNNIAKRLKLYSDSPQITDEGLDRLQTQWEAEARDVDSKERQMQEVPLESVEEIDNLFAAEAALEEQLKQVRTKIASLAQTLVKQSKPKALKKNGPVHQTNA